MTTSPAQTTQAPSTTARVPLRITLDTGTRSGHVDGAWWPQSRDLQTEAADLVDHFPQLAGQVERLLLAQADWDAVAGSVGTRLIEARRGTVKAGSFPSPDTHVVITKMGSGRRLRLMVVPSDTEPELAGTVMAQAADERNTRSPSDLLGLTGPDQGSLGFDTWV